MRYKNILILLLLVVTSACAKNRLYVNTKYSTEGKSIGVVNLLNHDMRLALGEYIPGGGLKYRRYWVKDNYWEMTNKFTDSLVSKLSLNHSLLKDVTRIDASITAGFVEKYQEVLPVYLDKLDKIESLNDFDYLLFIRDGDMILQSSGDGLIGQALAKRIQGYGFISDPSFGTRAFMTVYVYLVDFKTKKTVAFARSVRGEVIVITREPTKQEISAIKGGIQRYIDDGNRFIEISNILDKQKLTDVDKNKIIKLYEDHSSHSIDDIPEFSRKLKAKLYPKNITYQIAKTLFVEQQQYFQAKMTELRGAVVEEISHALNSNVNK